MQWRTHWDVSQMFWATTMLFLGILGPSGLWHLIDRGRHGTGGTGSEPSGFYAFLWGSTALLIPLAGIELAKLTGVTLSRISRYWRWRVAGLYGLFGGVAGLAFYDLATRACVECAIDGFVQQEILIGLAWSFLMAVVPTSSLLLTLPLTGRSEELRKILATVCLAAVIPVVVTVMAIAIFVWAADSSSANERARGVVAGIALRMSLLAGVMLVVTETFRRGNDVTTGEEWIGAGTITWEGIRRMGIDVPVTDELEVILDIRRWRQVIEKSQFSIEDSLQYAQEFEFRREPAMTVNLRTGKILEGAKENTKLGNIDLLLLRTLMLHRGTAAEGGSAFDRVDYATLIQAAWPGSNPEEKKVRNNLFQHIVDIRKQILDEVPNEDGHYHLKSSNCVAKVRNISARQVVPTRELVGGKHRLAAGAAIGLLGLTLGTWWWGKEDQVRIPLAGGSIQETWQPVFSLPWVRFGSDFGGVDGWNQLGVAAQKELMDRWFGEVSRQGVKGVVWFLFGDGRGGLLFDDAGNVRGLAPRFLTDYKAALCALRKHRMAVIWVVTDYTMGLDSEVEKGVQKFGRRPLLDNPTKRSTFLMKGLLPLLQEKFATKQVAGWIAMNEPENLLHTGTVAAGDMQAFLKECVDLIHQHRNEPVGIGHANLVGMLHNVDIAPVDFLTFHHYAGSYAPPVSVLRSFIGRTRRPGENRPIYVGEFNLVNPPGGKAEEFVATTLATGYAGAWGWSIRNRIDAKHEKAQDVDPQVALIEQYVRATDMVASRKEVAQLEKSAEDAMRRSVVWGIEQRRVQMQTEAFHREHAKVNGDQQRKILEVYIPSFEENKRKAANELPAAKQSLAANDTWVATATAKDRTAALAARAKSLEWVQRLEREYDAALGDLAKEQVNLLRATKLLRSHSYRAGEVATELAWFDWLLAEVQKGGTAQSTVRGQ